MQILKCIDKRVGEKLINSILPLSQKVKAHGFDPCIVGSSPTGAVIMGIRLKADRVTLTHNVGVRFSHSQLA